MHRFCWYVLIIVSSSLGSLIVSLSNGSLALLRPEDTGGLAVTESWHAHDHEPWIAAWNYWDTNVVYSGKPHPLCSIRRRISSPVIFRR